MPRRTVHGSTLTLRTGWRVRGDIDVRVKAVEVEELGVGEEVEVGVANAEVCGDVMAGRDGVEVGEVLRHVGCAAATVRSHGGLYVQERCS